MKFINGYLYHIYNQGNNHRKIFYDRDNYLFFLNKINNYILPYSDVLAWCLMPNHFHLMVLLNEIELIPDVPSTHLVTPSHQVSIQGKKKIRSFNDSIAIMLRSYTRAINKQQEMSGALFRQATKAECINCPNGISPSFMTKNGITQINVQYPEKQYPKICFDYIHQNPVKSGLVSKISEWEFSSALDYEGLRNGKLVNKVVARKYLEID